MKRAQLAINSISTRQNGLEEALDAYAAAGFQNVEFHLPLVKEYLGTGRTLEDARQMLRARNLTAIGGFEAAFETWSALDGRQANHALHRANAELIDALGGGVLVVGTDGPERRSVDALDELGAALGAFARTLDGLNVQIAVEFNWSPLVKSLRSVRRVALAASHPRVGILFDPAHYYVTTSKLDDLDAATVALIKHVHVDDMQDKPGELSDCNSDRALPGEGVLDLSALFHRLESHGYAGRFSIEMFSDALWALSARAAAAKMYASLLPLCDDTP